MSASPPSADDWLRGLIARSRATDGQPPFSDGALVELRQGSRELLRVADAAAAIVSGGAVSDADGGTAITEAEFVVDPDARRRGHGTALLDILLSRSPAGLRVWAHGDHPAARALAASHALTPVRTLLHLRAHSPSADLPEFVAKTAGIATDSGKSVRGDEIRMAVFRVGVDEGPWVAANARAFAGHPEQGAVSLADLRELEDEPWFDAASFLLAWDGDTLAGFCWLKVEGGAGEFYVVGVDPDRQGAGLGRALVEGGFARLAELGIRDAHLYVEGDNAIALRLYESFGFARDSIDIQYATQ